jgi:multicomponent Na+:H+ antiporter subunit A
MAGVPLTVGFVAKDGAYDALIGGSASLLWMIAAAVVASVLMGVAGLLAGVLPFRGAPADTAGHEPQWRLLLPPMLLATLGLVAGLMPSLLSVPLSNAASGLFRIPFTVAPATWHGVTPALILSAVTLIAIAVVFAIHTRVRRMWRPAFGTEQLYTRALSSVDTLSRILGPPLHSASLRSYVMVIMAFTTVVGVAALWTLPALTMSAKTDVRIHEVLVVVVIIAGAIAATRAKSTMAAVLSLGVVGYGVAMTFLLYGAPDLAMTQFSVETLTVLIYVLVFRHFRNLSDLSPRWVRYRDLIIGAGTGAMIGVLVLAVSTEETAARLREFFVEFGPTLGHGRNIVNVILVDFRGFDTLGEITVLATAAIGVRALLRLGGAQDASPTLAMTSAIFQTASRFLMPLLLLFAGFLLWRGHNEPGGGFTGGLVAASAFALYLIAFGVERARQALLVRPLTLLGTGLLIALASGIPAALRGQPFLTAQWSVHPMHLGTPMLFDLGVFLVVTGVVLMMVFNLAEEA